MIVNKCEKQVCAAMLFFCFVSPAYSIDLKSKLPGSTIYVTIKTAVSGSLSKEKYYVSKKGDKIFSPTGSYAKGDGEEYGLSKWRCSTLKYKYKAYGRIIWGKTRLCGKFYYRGNSLVLISRSRDNNGLGSILTSHYQTVLRFSDGGKKCRAFRTYSATNSAGTVGGRTTGVCVARFGRDLGVRKYSFKEEVACCISYYRKAKKTCVSITGNDRACTVTRSDCIRSVRNGSKFCG